MLKENTGSARSRLGKLVDAALAGEEVFLCRDRTPVVRLVPIPRLADGDPCRVIPALTIEAGDEAMEGLKPDEWGGLI